VRGSKLTIDMLTGESVILTDPGAAWSATAAPADKKGAGFTMQPGTAKRPSAIFYPRDKKAAEKKPSSAASDSTTAPGSDGGWAPTGPDRGGQPAANTQIDRAPDRRTMAPRPLVGPNLRFSRRAENPFLRFAACAARAL